MERISELMDGELEAREAQRQFARIKQDKELAHCWNTFHLIGDALRGERPLSREISGRVAMGLANEPTVLAPRSRSYATKRAATYAVSIAASLSAVALVVWIAFYNPLVPAEIAKAPSPPAPAPAVAAASEQLASVPSEGHMNEYLMAHQEFSPSTAIQGLAPYIRSVSGTQQAKGR
jgi:sigma-E factor negative regulatory protein RseA